MTHFNHAIEAMSCKEIAKLSLFFLKKGMTLKEVSKEIGLSLGTLEYYIRLEKKPVPSCPSNRRRYCALV